MKKILYVFLIVLVLGVSVAAYLFFHPVKVSMDDILTEKPIFYVRFSNTEKNIEKLSNTHFWQTISKIDHKEILKLFHASANIAAAAQTVIDQAQSPQLQDMLKKYFGKEVAVVVYPSKEKADASSKEWISQLFVGTVLMTRIGNDVKTMEFISGLVGQYQAIIKEKYNHATIYDVSIPNADVRLYFTRIGDILILSLNPTGLKQSLDTYHKKINSLAKDKDFLSIKQASLNFRDFLGYANLEKAIDSLDEHSDNVSASVGKRIGRRQWQQLMLGESGVKTIGIMAQFDDLVRIKTVLSFDKDTMNDDWAQTLSNCHPKENKTLLFVPQDALYYQWNACLNLEHFWAQATDQVNKLDSSGGQSSLNKINVIERSLGLSIEDDVIPAFGDEVGGFLSGVDVSSEYPIPQINIFVGLKNQDSVQKFVQALSEKTSMSLKSELYRDKTIEFISTPWGEKVEPSLAYLDNYLVLAINRPALKKTMDVYFKMSPSILDAVNFKIINQGLTDNNIGVSVVDGDHMLDVIDGLIQWSGKWLDRQDDKKIAFKAGSELRLRDLETKRKTLAQQMDDANENVKSLEQALSPLSDGSSEYVQKQTDLKKARAELEDLMQQAQIIPLQIAELKKVIAGYDQESDHVKEQKMVIDDLVRPLIDGLKSFEYFGQKMNFSNMIMDIDVFLKAK